MLTGAQSRIIAESRERVKRALDDAGIEIPSPHLQLLKHYVFGLNLLLKH
jgi:small-conductance mechanosensitive channel